MQLNAIPKEQIAASIGSVADRPEIKGVLNNGGAVALFAVPFIIVILLALVGCYFCVRKCENPWFMKAVNFVKNFFIFGGLIKVA